MICNCRAVEYEYEIGYRKVQSEGFDALAELRFRRTGKSLGRIIEMANPGAGSKFVSVNLNKSYGQPSHPPFGYNRARPGSHGGGGGGGGMVVLSRPRSSQKIGSKLSVPPPLNLPSLRKEHERFDPAGSGSGSASGATAGIGSRPTSSGMGWSKPGAVALQEKDGKPVAESLSVVDTTGQNLHTVVDGAVSRGSSVYMPPSARSNSVGFPVPRSTQPLPPVERAVLLRGEDFPSLQAALPATAGPIQKQKDASHSKQKQSMSEESSSDQRDNFESSPQLHMRPQLHCSQVSVGNGFKEDGGSDFHKSGGSSTTERVRKHEEYFPGPLPLVKLSPRSDWADDERDTGHGFAERARDNGFSKAEAYWVRDFDIPRSSVLLQKPVPNTFDRWGQHDSEIGKSPSSEVSKLDPYGRDVRTPSREGREGSSWRGTSAQRDGFNSQEVASDRNVVGARLQGNLNREWSKETKYSQSSYGVNSREELSNGMVGQQDAVLGRRGIGYEQTARQSWNNMAERITREGYGVEQSKKLRSDAFKKNSYSYSSASKRLPTIDPLLNFSKEKRPFAKNERPYLEEEYGRDPLSPGIVGFVKRKNNATKQADFHDPVRESFEAELERVQKLQEQERQRIIEEQERAIELARKEEEERERQVREQEELRRRLEEEAREAAWRVEQERLEAMKRAEEQKIAREEERRRMLMEEERRKEAALQKLLELEARIAKRQAEVGKNDDSSLRLVDEKNWDEGERMVERITTSASSDSSSTFIDRGGRPSNSWRGDAFGNESGSNAFLHDHENGHYNQRRDAAVVGRSFARKEVYGGAGFVPSRASFKGGVLESHVDDFSHLRGHRWNLDGDHLGRSSGMDYEFHDNLAENYGDVGWGQGHFRPNNHPPYTDGLYPYSEPDGLYSFGRARHSTRQPRVLPPPSLASSTQKSSFRGDNDHPGPSTFQDTEMGHDRILEGTGIIDGKAEHTVSDRQKLDMNSVMRCESQSSLSVSSPPSSPTQLSHDDLDEKDEPVVVLTSQSEKENIIAASGVSTDVDVDDDEEEWTVETNGELQEQEEYDEDEDGYQEEDEVHEGDDENADLAQELGDLQLEEEKLDVGFDRGVEAGISGDKIEGNSEYEENTFVEEEKSFDEVLTDEQSLQPVDNSSIQVSLDNASKKIEVVEGAARDMVIQPSNSASETLSTAVVSSTSNPSGPSSSALPGPGQAELPVKLQFGLFSGPPLIPSPVPAIQIGSIQMPLHLHPQVGPSQPPLFQFGQLRYTSPMSQGILPLGPQSVSFVQPNVAAHYSLNQNPISVQPEQDKFSVQNLIKDNAVSNLLDNQPGPGSRHFNVPQELAPKEESSLQVRESEHNTRSASQEQQIESASSQTVSSEIGRGGPKAQGPSTGEKVKRPFYAVKSSGLRSSFPTPEASSVFQRRPHRNIPRTEFRVRENAERRQSSGLNSFNYSARNGPRKGALLSKHTESELGRVVSQAIDSQNKAEKVAAREVASKSQSERISLPNGEGRLKRNINSEEDVDAPLQSGIVRVFKQPGIETPSDEDDFIEVRSKRQMLNDRREQREKENKAKTRVSKAPRKSRSTAQFITVSNSNNAKKTSASLGGEATSNVHAAFVVNEGRGASSGFNAAIVSQSLAPIGTPPLNADVQTDMRSQSIKSSAISSAEKSIGPALLFETKNKALGNVQTSLGSWGNSLMNQQVMSLTQTQLDEAMKPALFDAHMASNKVQSSVSESAMTASSILPKEKPFSSVSSPINSLLAGERIQFGAVTSPTILPPSTRAIPHGIGPPGPSKPDIQIAHKLPPSKADCSLFFEKEKHNEPLEDCEAEAEAAASAVAVAAISNDETTGNQLHTVSVSEVNQESTTHSRAEESLSVSLPADLSVETPPISSWPGLPSPQNSSGPMLSHFAGAPPSHFPFYEMNHMLGAPIFAFGPHEESAGNQTQAQKNGGSVPGPGQLGNWQQSLSAVDSFYGPPAGFTAPFIGPPGVQGPPHMVVYNHFAPVGQFGQVGLSFMGTTYIPSGKQPDWKHNPTTSSMGIAEVDANNNMNAQRTPPPSMAGPIQHLSPGSQLLPMPSPMAMFDVSPFQSSPEMQVQGRWPHLPPPPLHSVALSPPLQHQQAEAFPSSQFSHGPTLVDPSITANKSTITQFADELGLVDRTSSKNVGPSVQAAVIVDTGGGADTVQNGNSSKNSNSNSSFKIQSSSQQKNSFSNYQRGGGVSQKNSSGGEWSHNRRMGFQGRNQPFGGEKSYPSSKMKQIYVAKQTSDGSS